MISNTTNQQKLQDLDLQISANIAREHTTLAPIVCKLKPKTWADIEEENIKLYASDSSQDREKYQHTTADDKTKTTEKTQPTSRKTSHHRGRKKFVKSTERCKNLKISPSEKLEEGPFEFTDKYSEISEKQALSTFAEKIKIQSDRELNCEKRMYEIKENFLARKLVKQSEQAFALKDNYEGWQMPEKLFVPITKMKTLQCLLSGSGALLSSYLYTCRRWDFMFRFCYRAVKHCLNVVSDKLERFVVSGMEVLWKLLSPNMDFMNLFRPGEKISKISPIKFSDFEWPVFINLPMVVRAVAGISFLGFSYLIYKSAPRSLTISMSKITVAQAQEIYSQTNQNLNQDLRSDDTALIEVAHRNEKLIDCVQAGNFMRYLDYLLLQDSRCNYRFFASYELLSQIAGQTQFAITMSHEEFVKRMAHQASRMQSINYNRYVHLKYFISPNTQWLAKCWHHSYREVVAPVTGGF
jgi:hypothetical protein